MFSPAKAWREQVRRPCSSFVAGNSPMPLQPLVSVVIPFHNHRQYIELAIAKLREQTYTNWEALLVDNNSDDGSAEIAQALAQQYSEKVRYHFEPQQGIPHARNRGLAEACGKYITFLDVDDEFAPTKLTDHVSVLEAHPEVAMVYGLTRRVYLPHGRSLIQNSGIAREGLNRPPYLAINWLRTFYHLPQTGATLVRTDVARRLSGFDENLRLGNDDIAFHLKIAFNYNIWFQPREAVIYYRHSLSAGARLNRERSVAERYLDAHRSWVIQYAIEYELRTGDARARYWAERALVNSMAEFSHHQSKNKNHAFRRRLLRGMFSEQRRKGYLGGAFLRVLLELHAWLPHRQARSISRTLYKVLSIARPTRFPRTLPVQP